jgi:hypothetical protein
VLGRRDRRGVIASCPCHGRNSVVGGGRDDLRQFGTSAAGDLANLPSGPSCPRQWGEEQRQVRHSGLACHGEGFAKTGSGDPGLPFAFSFELLLNSLSPLAPRQRLQALLSPAPSAYCPSPVALRFELLPTRLSPLATCQRLQAPALAPSTQFSLPRYRCIDRDMVVLSKGTFASSETECWVAGPEGRDRKLSVPWPEQCGLRRAWCSSAIWTERGRRSRKPPLRPGLPAAMGLKEKPKRGRRPRLGLRFSPPDLNDLE